MKADLTLDLDDPETVQQAVDPDLQDSDRVQFTTHVDESLHIQITADSLGVLRGALNTATKLTKLSTRFTGDS